MTSRHGERGTAPAGLVLEVRAGARVSRTLTVEEGLLLGRGSADAEGLDDDPQLSRRHAQITRRPDGSYVIEDLDSTNGTVVNGMAIRTPTVLVPGDELVLGSTVLTVAASAAAKAPPAPVSEPPDDTAIRPGLPVLELTLAVEPDTGEAQARLGGPGSVRLRLREGRWEREKD